MNNKNVISLFIGVIIFCLMFYVGYYWGNQESYDDWKKNCDFLLECYYFNHDETGCNQSIIVENKTIFQIKGTYDLVCLVSD